MNKINLLITASLMLAGFTACNNDNSKAKEDAVRLSNYVDSVEDLSPVYTNAYWSSLNEGYQLRLTASDKTVESLEIADKESLEKSKLEYAKLQSTYELNIAAAEKEATLAASSDYRQVLRNRLFGEGLIGTDLNFGFVTAENLLSVFQKFVNTVAENKKEYTREDWDEIKVLYEALDTRKNTVEKDLPKGDNLKIAGLKIKFSAIKATHRGGTKGEENKKAKE